MNVLASDRDPIQAARNPADRHVRSQIGEATAILNDALHVLTPGGGPRPPRATSDRFVRWAAADVAHYSWLWVHLDELHREHRLRFGEAHEGGIEVLEELARLHPEGERKVRSWGLVYTVGRFERDRVGRKTLAHVEDDVDAYRQVLAWKYRVWTTKGRPPAWTNRPRPAWLGDAPDFEVLDL